MNAGTGSADRPGCPSADAARPEWRAALSWYRLTSVPLPLRIGLLSDTHGLLRPEALRFLLGCDYLIHAGDIGTPGILDALGALAPVTTVRGNNDQASWASHIGTSELIRLGGIFVYVVHDAADARPPPGTRIVVSGHSHQPKIEQRGAVLWVNPGSCGPRRFRLPVSVGEILIENEHISARTVQLELGD